LKKNILLSELYVIVSTSGLPLVQKVSKEKSWIYLWKYEEDAKTFMNFQKINKENYNIIFANNKMLLDVFKNLESHTIVEMKVMDSINKEEII
jgi:hypothetical protein